MSVYGYDPARVEVLHRRTRAAIAALGTTRSDDPAAFEAMQAVRRMRETLEQAWIPLIEAIGTSTAMTAWRHALLGADPSSHAFVGGAPTSGATASWIFTNGLDDLTDAEVVDRVRTTIELYRTAVLNGTDMERAERRMATIVEEAVRRARHDRARFAAAMGSRSGDRGAVAILGAIEVLAATARGPRRHGIPPAALDLAELLAPLATAGPVAEVIAEHLRASTALPPLIAATSRAWDPTVLVELTTGLVRAIDERDYLLARMTPMELAGNVSALAHTVADDPTAALRLLGDDLALDFLATGSYLDPSSVEAVVTAGLVRAPSAGGEAIGEALTALSRLVVISDDDHLNDGMKRGLAASMLTFYPLLAPQLDVRIPVVVPFGADPDDTVEVGSYCDLQRLFGQLLTDQPSQLVLGAMTERFRDAQTAGLAGVIAARPADAAAEHRARIAAALADPSTIAALVLRSRAARTSLDAYEHGVVVGRAKSVITWATMIGSLAVPSSRAAFIPVIPVASQVVTTALDVTRPSRLPDLGVATASAVGFTVAVIGLPARAPQVRSALGLGSVPATTWRRLDDLLEELSDTDDHGRRLKIHSTIVAIAADDPDLDLFVTQLEALSGDAANAAPQPPASCT